MTTPADPWIVTIPAIRDRESLLLVSKLIDAHLTVLEAQVIQLKTVRTAIDQRIKEVGRSK